MAKKSAGLLLFRESAAGLEVLLVHPGGPFWAKKDDGAWSIPKGEFADDEEPLTAAKREFEEEMGVPPGGRIYSFGAAQAAQAASWCLRGLCRPTSTHAGLKSNMFSMEWPPKSGRQQEFPEIDRAGWFAMEIARVKILKGQAGFLDQLLDRLRKCEVACIICTLPNLPAR